jgi:hypothetical protein
MRYRLAVVGPNMVDVVRFAGGLLFDRVTAGWDVLVIVDDDPAARALQILGADTLDLESALALRGHGPLPNALAVAGDLCSCDPRVREGVLLALDDGLTEVTLWGETWPSGFDYGTDAKEHRLSVAAQAFKAQALAAAAVSSDRVGRTELFCRGELLTRRSAGSDLIAAT